MSSASLQLFDSRLEYNIAEALDGVVNDQAGGAIFLGRGSTAKLYNVFFYHNYAKWANLYEGSAITLQYDAQLQVMR